MSFLAALGAPALGQAKDCTPTDVPPGVRVPERVGCKPQQATEPTHAKPRTRVKAGSQPGFIDLGGGLEVRISGQADVDAGYRR
jgi:hypothetical protein